MQQYDKEINALKLKNAYLQKQLEFESSLQKKLIFVVSIFLGGLISVFLIVKPANLTDGIILSLIFAFVAVIVKFIGEFLGRLVWKRLRKN